MKAISIHDLKLGRAISKDVFNDLGNIILSEGTEITERHLEYFSKHNIETVFGLSTLNQTIFLRVFLLNSTGVR